MPTSSSTVFCAYLFLDLFLPVDVLFSLLTVNRNPHLYTSNTDHDAPGLTLHAIVRHHQKPPGQFWQSPVHQNPVRTFRTFSPVCQVTCVARNHIFSPWNQFDGVLPRTHQNAREQNKGEGNIYLRHETPQQASAQWQCCTASFFVPLCCLPGRECS